MKIINPTSISNILTYISRFNVVSADTSTRCTIYNPQDRSYTDITSGCTFSGDAGFSYINIPQSAYTFTENAKVKITVENNISNEVLFIGDLLPTTQPTSSYKLTTNKYEYK